MDATFNSAIKAYRDNFLEYSTSGKSSYKTAYESALKSMNTVLDKLESELKTTKSQEIPQEINSYQAKLIKQKDDLDAARLLSTPPTITPAPNLSTQYITVGVLGGILLIVMMM